MHTTTAVITRSLSALMLATALYAQNPAVTTAQYNRSRTAANQSETVLNTATVNAGTFGQLSSWSVDGYVFAQPLYVPNLTIKGATRNALFVATMNNSVYAFDTGAPGSPPLWRVQLGSPVTNIAQYCPAFGSTNGYELGILSTPAIDLAAKTLYAVASNPGSGNYNLVLHAIDIVTGDDNATPVPIIPGTNTLVQRAALLLGNGRIYAALGNCGPDAGPYNGTVVVHDQASLSQLHMFNDTPNGYQGGIWQSGGGPVLDTAGNVYLNTGNETPTGADYASSVVKLSSGLSVQAHFTPVNAALLNQYDLDISSAGPLEIPGGFIVSGGKEGVGYVLNESDMSIAGQFQATKACSPLSFSGCYQIHQFAFWNNFLYVWGAAISCEATYTPTACSRLALQTAARTRITVERH